MSHSTSLSDVSLQNLSSDNLDIKRWINAALVASAIVANPADAGATSSSSASVSGDTEGSASRLFNRLQAHSQEVAVTVEDMITQTLLRLPRTQTELERMTAETQQLAQRFEHLGEVIKPAIADDASHQHARTLKQLHASQKKLETCADVLRRAKQLEQQMKHIDHAVQAISEGSALTPDQSMLRRTIPQREGAGDANIESVAAAIAEVKDTLAQIQRIDPHFGDTYTDSLKDYEQKVQKSVELECVQRMFRKDDGPTPLALLHTLRSIGRDGAILDEYARVATQHELERFQRGLKTISSMPSASSGYTNTLVLLLQDHLKSTGQLLGTELEYLFPLLVGSASGTGSGELALADERDAAGQPTHQDFVSNGKTAVVRSLHQDPGHLTHGAEFASTPANSIEARKESLLRVLLTMVKNLTATSAAPLKAALEKLPTNADLVACFEASRDFSIRLPGASSKTAEQLGDQGLVTACSGGHSAILGKLAATISAQALAELSRVFMSPELLTQFTAREYQSVQRLIWGGSLAQPATIAQERPSFLQHRDGSGIRAVLSAMGSSLVAIMHFFPDKTLQPCVSLWCTALMGALEHLKPSEGLVPKAESATEGAEELLERLIMAKGTVLPALVAAQKSMTEVLVADRTIAQLYPIAAKDGEQLLQEQLWNPLLTNTLLPLIATLEAALRSAIVAPVTTHVEGYDTLPLWKGQQSLGGPTLAPFTPAHIAPSEAIRRFGEAIMEIPLTLEMLGGGEDVWRSGLGVTMESTDVAADGTEQWLTDVVSTAVKTFVEAKVLNIIISADGAVPAHVGPPKQQAEPPQAMLDKREAAAVEQLVTDLDYLQNILSAVSDTPSDDVQRILGPLRELQLPQRAPIVVKTLIKH